MRSSVDLPEPERPSSPTISPERSVRSTSSSTTRSALDCLGIGLPHAADLQQGVGGDGGVHGAALSIPGPEPGPTRKPRHAVRRQGRGPPRLAGAPAHSVSRRVAYANIGRHSTRLNPTTKPDITTTPSTMRAVSPASVAWAM